MLAHAEMLPDLDALRDVIRFVTTTSPTYAAALDPSAARWIRRSARSAIGEHVLAVYVLGDTTEAAFLGFGLVPYRVRLCSGIKDLAGRAYVVNPAAPTRQFRAFQPKHLRPLATVRSSADDIERCLGAFRKWNAQIAAEFEHRAHAARPALMAAHSTEIDPGAIVSTAEGFVCEYGEKARAKRAKREAPT